MNGIDKSRAPKEKSLQQCKSSLEAMYATKEGLESELHQELMEQLSVADQKKVDIKIFKRRISITKRSFVLGR